MIRTGEASGNLNETLKNLADFMEKEEEFKDSLRATLAYPLFVFCIGVLTVIVLLVFVIPRLVTMFEDMGQVLPLPTRILIATSTFLRGYSLVLVAAIAGFVYFFKRSLANSQARQSMDRFKLKLFFFGQLILKTEICRLTRTLSLLLGSGIPITTSLDIASSVLENQVLKSETKGFKEQIASGLSFSGALKQSKFFPDFVVTIVTIGEESGELESSLMRIAIDYERQVDRALKMLTRMSEPVIILVMGLVVGFVVLSMLLPIFQINLIAK